MRRVILALLGTAVGLALLLSYKAHTAGPVTSALSGPDPATALGGSAPGATTAPSTGSGAAANPSASAGASSKSGVSAAGNKSGTYVGDPVSSQFSTIQVEVVVSGGKISDIKLLEDTDEDEHSAQVDGYAVPILRSEALSAQSANVDMVSGATFTSQSYTQSLQSAIDRAGL
jgi:uncharacterized protein with FMN-binding domain